jgi:hypothetical protein
MRALTAYITLKPRGPKPNNVPHVKARKAIYYIAQPTITAILKNLLDEVCCGLSNRLFGRIFLPCLNTGIGLDAGRKDLVSAIVLYKKAGL